MVEKLTREDAKALVGSVGDLTIAEILDLGATRAELAEARAWIENDEAMLNEGQRISSDRVAQLVEILTDREEEEVLSDQLR